MRTQEAATQVTNTSIERTLGNGIEVTSPVGVPTLTGNSVVGAASTAIRIQGRRSTWRG